MYEKIKKYWYIPVIIAILCFFQFIPTRADRQIKRELISASNNTTAAIELISGAIDSFQEYQQLHTDLAYGVGLIKGVGERILESSDRYDEGLREITNMVGGLEDGFSRLQTLDARSEDLLNDSLRLVEDIKSQNDKTPDNDRSD